MTADTTVTLLDAVNMALQYELKHDPNTVLLGEDIGLNGGVFRATANLQSEFGPTRVMDTPLAESMIAGVAVGMAVQGLRPVAEIQFMGFIYAAMEQIIGHAARLRNRTCGRLSCPLVIRAPFGGGIHAPEHHSECTEAMFAHIPGLRVVIPSSPKRAYGLLLAAIRNPDPVIFLEPKRIYRAVKHSVSNDGQALPLDTCFTLRSGRDITLVSWGAQILETLDAAEELSKLGIEAEVIDVASLKPLDMNTIYTSIAYTGRCIIVHEAARSFGAGAEIAANLAEFASRDLTAPVVRICGYDTVMPLLKNEQYYLPCKEDIVDAAAKLASFK